MFGSETTRREVRRVVLCSLSICALSIIPLLFIENSTGSVLFKDSSIEGTTSVDTFKIVIVRNEARLLLYRNEQLFRIFAVAVGNSDMGKITPAGRYKIVTKVKDPIMIWRSGKVIPPNDPRNSYGARWIGLADFTTGRYRGCGIQGTNVERSIGKHITVGCVRMHNKDIVELFELIDIGTEVVIR